MKCALLVVIKARGKGNVAYFENRNLGRDSLKAKRDQDFFKALELEGEKSRA
jgi:hypothetical protein